MFWLIIPEYTSALLIQRLYPMQLDAKTPIINMAKYNLIQLLLFTDILLDRRQQILSKN